jgi:kynurenine 3-monooxygenase
MSLHFKVKETGIPMPGRIIHNLDGKTSFIPYGKKGQVET